MALKDLIDRQLGVSTTHRVNHERSDISTTVGMVLNNHPGRLAAIFVNLGGVDVYLAPDRQVSSTHGIVIPANGGNYVWKWDEDFHMVGMEWFVVAASGTCDLLCLEILEEFPGPPRGE